MQKPEGTNKAEPNKFEVKVEVEVELQVMCLRRVMSKSGVGKELTAIHHIFDAQTTSDVAHA